MKKALLVLAAVTALVSCTDRKTDQLVYNTNKDIITVSDTTITVHCTQFGALSPANEYRYLQTVVVERAEVSGQLVGYRKTEF